MIAHRAREDERGEGWKPGRLLHAGVFTWLLAFAAFVGLFRFAYDQGALDSSLRWQTSLTAGAVLLLGSAVWLSRLRRRPPGRIATRIQAWLDRISRRKLPSLLLMALLVPVVPLALYGPSDWYPDVLFLDLFLFWATTLAISLLAVAFFPRSTWDQRVLASAIGYGLFVRLLGYVPDVSTYPLSLGWSEASRYYYASLFFSKSIYGVSVSPSELHPTRYLLQSVPFLLPGSPLWLHRLWQVFLWWALPALVGWLLVRRYQLRSRWLRVFVAGWVVLYLLQGPMHYHLLVMVAFVVAGVDPKRPLRSTVVILAASVWAGVSRLNWYPVPGILGACLYVLEVDPPLRSWRGVARWPLLWFVFGSLTALASQALYVQMSGQDLNRFTSSLFSDLLFYRLFPNPTYSFGILPALLLASAPLVISLWSGRREWTKRVGLPADIVFGAALAILGAGGLVVSLKIGGGSNLHNLDAFLILLLLAGFSLLVGRPHGPAGNPDFSALPPLRELALLVAVPILFAVSVATPWARRDQAAAVASLDQLREAVQAASRRGERILFISQRHALTFGLIPDVPLEPDFETVFLMEMAMSNNRPYLDHFSEMLEEHAYNLIVAGRLGTFLQGSDYEFGEENDAWVARIATPILENYRLEKCFDLAACLYIPKTNSPDG